MSVTVGKTRAIWEPIPNSPQVEFMSRTEDEVLFGGAAGGAKTMSLLHYPVRDLLRIPKLQALYCQRENNRMRDVLVMAQEYFLPLGASYNKTEQVFTFPNGSRYEFGHMEHEESKIRYQGRAFEIICFDELTQFSERQYLYLFSRNRGAFNPNYRAKMRAATNPGGIGHCVPFGEVLTPHGWVDISSMKVGDGVYTIDANGCLKNSVVEQFHESEHSGEMINVECRGLSITCTPNHRIAKVGGTHNTKMDKYSLVAFDELPGQATILRTAEWDGNGFDEFEVPKIETGRRKNEQPGKIRAEYFLSLLGWFLSEGWTIERDKVFGICQLKKDYRDEIRRLLTNCEFKFNEVRNGFTVYAPDWWSYFKQFGKCRDKFIPLEFKNLKKELLRPLFESLMNGDGHWETDDSGQYYTISKHLADDVCEIAFKLGYVVCLSSRFRSNRDGLSYCVNFKKCKSGGTEILTGNHLYDVNTTTKRKTLIKRQEYNGKVYCIGVPETHSFVIRQNGSIWISGNSWVKSRFIDALVPGKTRFFVRLNDEDIRCHPDTRYAKSRAFIPSRVTDNPYYRDSAYVANLMALPENERRALLEGDWNAFEGQFFRKWRRSIHVVEPFELPQDWAYFGAYDYGYSAPACYLLAGVNYDGDVYFVREFYKEELSIREQADAILQLESGIKVSARIADNQIFEHRMKSEPGSDDTIDQIFYRESKGKISFGRSNKDRMSGWAAVKEYMAWEGEYDGTLASLTRRPQMYVCANCTNLIREIEGAVYAPSGNAQYRNDKTARAEDLDTRGSDHALDPARYLLQFIYAPRKIKQRPQTVREMFLEQGRPMRPKGVIKF